MWTREWKTAVPTSTKVAMYSNHEWNPTDTIDASKLEDYRSNYNSQFIIITPTNIEQGEWNEMILT